MPLARRKAGGDQRVFDARRLGHVNALVVQKRARAALRRVNISSRSRIEDHAGDQFARALQRQSHVEHRKSVREIRGAIQRIDVPAIFGRSFVPAAFFGDDRVRGKVASQALDNQALRWRGRLP